MEIRATTTGAEDCAAVITFMSQHQTQQEVVESLSAAVLKAVKGATDARVMKELLERARTEPRSMDRD